MKIGDRFGRWEVVDMPNGTATGKKVLCKCDCGVQREVQIFGLINGKTKSCGCIRREMVAERNKTHGLANNVPEYRVWKAMRWRCLDTKGKNKKYYGDRGISVCERWNSFENFYEDMGPRPSPKHTIDRIDNDGNYESDNCRWATPQEQGDNRRGRHYVWYKGRRYTIAQLARKVGMNQTMLLRRLSRGWTIKKAVETPNMKDG